MTVSWIVYDPETGRIVNSGTAPLATAYLQKGGSLLLGSQGDRLTQMVAVVELAPVQATYDDEMIAWNAAVAEWEAEVATYEEQMIAYEEEMRARNLEDPEPVEPVPPGPMPEKPAPLDAASFLVDRPKITDLNTVPAGTQVIIDNVDHGICDDGLVEIETDIAGTYKIRLNPPFPFQPYEEDVVIA